MELLEIRFNGDLAAFVLWIRQGDVRLVFDNRVAAAWTDYSVGLIANNEALRTAAADPGVGCLDWGAGVQRYKLSSSNQVFPHEQLTAWSSRTVRLWLGGVHRLRGMTAGRTAAAEPGAEGSAHWPGHSLSDRPASRRRHRTGNPSVAPDPIVASGDMDDGPRPRKDEVKGPVPVSPI